MKRTVLFALLGLFIFSGIALAAPPADPTGLGQVNPVSSASVAEGDWIPSPAILLKATSSDPDTLDTFRLQAEVVQVGSQFTSPTSVVAPDGVQFFDSSVTLTGLSQEVSVTVVLPTDGVQYIWQVRAIDALGSVSGWVEFSAGRTGHFGIDTTDPINSGLEDGFTLGFDQDFTTDDTAVNIVFDIDDPNSGIATYQFALGTSPGSDNIVGLKTITIGTTLPAQYQESGLTLQNNITYYASIVATNNAGGFVAATTDGITVAVTDPQINYVSDLFLNPAGGEAITVLGSFPLNATVSMGQQSITPTVLTTQVIQFVTPALSAGNVDLVVSNSPLESQDTKVLYVTSTSTGSSSVIGGGTVDDYRMVTPPVLLDREALLHSFVNTFGTFDPTVYRAVWYNPRISGYQDFAGISETDFIFFGGSLWVLSAEPTTIQWTGYDASNISFTEVFLKPGWNQIGHGFGSSVFWDDIQISTDGQFFIFANDTGNTYFSITYDFNPGTGDYVTSSSLTTEVGYFVENSHTDTIAVRIYSPLQGKPENPNPPSVAPLKAKTSPPAAPGARKAGSSSGSSKGCLVSSSNDGFLFLGGILLGLIALGALKR